MRNPECSRLSVLGPVSSENFAGSTVEFQNRLEKNDSMCFVCIATYIVYSCLFIDICKSVYDQRSLFRSRNYRSFASTAMSLLGSQRTTGPELPKEHSQCQRIQAGKKW